MQICEYFIVYISCTSPFNINLEHNEQFHGYSQINQDIVEFKINQDMDVFGYRLFAEN